jgi:uncharacterized protein
MNAYALKALEFLSAHHVLSLALCKDGLPHACSLMYAHGGFTLYWVSDPASRHSQIIDSDTQVAAAATIAPDYTSFEEIRGLQLSGLASQVAGVEESARGLALLRQRYSFLASAGKETHILADALIKSKVYQLIPETVTFIDNTRSFGSKTVLQGDDLLLSAIMDKVIRRGTSALRADSQRSVLPLAEFGGSGRCRFGSALHSRTPSAARVAPTPAPPLAAVPAFQRFAFLASEIQRYHRSSHEEASFLGTMRV